MAVARQLAVDLRRVRIGRVSAEMLGLVARRNSLYTAMDSLGSPQAVFRIDKIPEI